MNAVYFREQEKARRWQEIRLRQNRLRADNVTRNATLEQSMLKSGFTMSDINGTLSQTHPVVQTDTNYPSCFFPLLELQFGFDSGAGGQQSGSSSRPTAPSRQNRLRSIDYNAQNGHDMNGLPSDAHPHGNKGILRASSEMHVTGRQGRDHDRKARTPELNSDMKEDKKKRGKSPFA